MREVMPVEVLSHEAGPRPVADSLVKLAKGVGWSISRLYILHDFINGHLRGLASSSSESADPSS